MSTTPTLIETLYRHAEADPDRLCLTYLAEGRFPAEQLTYAQLQQRVQCVARHLDGSVSDRAILVYPPGIDFVVAFLACLAAGVIAVPAPEPRPGRFRQTLERCRWIARDSSAAQVLSNERIMDRAYRSLEDMLIPDLAGLPWIATDRIVDDACADTDFGSRTRIGTTEIAFLQYTSGSTARPRGVMVRHQNLTANLEYANQVGTNDCDSVSLSWLPHYHDMGLIEGILRPLWTGYPAYLMAPAACLQRPVRWLEAISRNRATHSGGPNFIYDLAVRKIPSQDTHAMDLSSWRVAYNGAEMVRADTLRRFGERFATCGFNQRSFFPVYGLAEATLLVTSPGPSELPNVVRLGAESLNRGAAREARPHERAVPYVGCGRARADVDVAVTDPETCVQLAPDAIGEIWVAGPGVTLGYWNRPEETRVRFRARLADGRGPYLRTGDLGFLRDGTLFVTGRLKDQIVIRGVNYCPSDIENTIATLHRGVRHGTVAAFAIDVSGEESFALAVELDAADCDQPLEFEDPGGAHTEVAHQIAELVATEHEIRPHAVSVVRRGALPRTSSGKIQRHACREAYEADSWTRVTVLTGARVAEEVPV